MISKESLEKLLRVNGLSPSAPDEQFKELLLQAKWSGEDIETALTVLRENKVTDNSRVSSVHQTFTSGDKLSSSAISNMLGVNVTLPAEDLNRRTYKGGHTREYVIILVISIMVAAIFFGIFSWHFGTPDFLFQF